MTVALPVTRHHSVKLYGGTGVVTRTGGNFNTVGMAWQYRWGGGLLRLAPSRDPQTRRLMLARLVRQAHGFLGAGAMDRRREDRA